jgi:RNA binding exosome subunit
MCGVPNLSLPSSKFPIAYVEIRVFSHGTEDLDKVESAVKATLPEALVENLVFSKLSLTGHYGNPIVLVEVILKDKALLLSALEKIATALSPLDKEQLSAEMMQHIEKHNLYLRLDKQNALLGTLKITSNDPIHVKINFKNKTPEQIIDICKQAGLFQ